MKNRFSPVVCLLLVAALLLSAGTFAMPGRNASIGLRWRQ